MQPDLEHPLSASPIELILDTHALLHYLPPDELDWERVTGHRAASITLVIPRVVVDEIEKKKHEGTSDRIRKRAKARSSWIAGHRRGDAPLKNGVSLTVERRRPTKYRRGLDKNSGDDVIAATTLARMRRRSARVALATNDQGLHMTAEEFKIEVVEMPEQFAAPADLDASQAEARDLREELARRDAEGRPSATVHPWRSDKPSLLRVVRRRYKYDVRAIMRAAKYTHRPMEVEPSTRPFAGATTGNRLGDMLSGVTPLMKEKYNDELAEWYKAFEQHLLQLDTVHATTLSRQFLVVLAVSNSGTGPLLYARLRLRIKSEQATTVSDRSLPFPDAPTPPRRPQPLGTSLARNDYSTLFPGLGHVVMPEELDHPKIHVMTFKEWPVEIYLPRLRQHCTEAVPGIYVSFEDVDPSGFAIEYELIADNMPDRVTGVIHVAVDEGEVRLQGPNPILGLPPTGR